MRLLKKRYLTLTRHIKNKTMHKPTKEEFLKLAEESNLIPVYKEIVADIETPASTFIKIDDGSYSYLL